MSKNIVVFSDGTGQERSKGIPSNVCKLFNMVLDGSPKQIAFYSTGLGTGWRKITGRIYGNGISKRIKECYKFISKNYENKDEIYLFGFSRGAATVRSLAGFIDLFGILPKSELYLLGDAWKIYEDKSEKRKKDVDLFFKRHHPKKCEIKFIGVWDTVTALGSRIPGLNFFISQVLGFRHEFHNYDLNKNVQYACHALSIDDERATFHPTLWNENVHSHQTVKQVWFCGMHADVGGGYKTIGLSNITLNWMLTNATGQGLLMNSTSNSGASIPLNPDSPMGNSRSGISFFFIRKERFWPKVRADKPVVNPSVKQRQLNPKNLKKPKYNPWILQNSGAYTVEKNP